MRLWASLLAASFAFALCGAGPARAGVIVWDFTYNSAPGSLDVISGSGTMTTSDVLVGGTYALIGISGTRSASSLPTFANITGLSPYASADNLLYPAFPFVDFSGISFTTDAGIDFNLYNQPGQYELRSDNNPGGFPDFHYPITLDVTRHVPEPSTFALIAVALMAMAGAGAAHRRRRTEA